MISRKWLTILLLGLSSTGVVLAEIPAMHQGATDPVAEGFLNAGGVTSGSPVFNDSGHDAWQVVAPVSNIGYYFKSFDYEPAFQQGWKLTGRLRILNAPAAAGTFSYVGLNSGTDRPRFDIIVSQSGADAKIELFGSDLSYTLPGAANAWIDLELVYNPDTATAALSVNGIPVLEGYMGLVWFNEGRGLDFGTSGHTTNFNLAKFEYGAAGGLASLVLKKSTIAGCKTGSATVTLAEPAPAGGQVVTISDTLASANPPLSVTVPAGLLSKKFSFKTTAVAESESGEVTVTMGSESISQPLTVRPIGMLSVSLLPGTVAGGNVVTGTAKLECKAGPGPILIELGSTNAAVANPTVPSVLVPAGVQTAPFTVTTAPVATTTKPKITGRANGVTKSKTLTVTP